MAWAVPMLEEKTTPVPSNGAVCGDPGSLSATESVAGKLPAAVGEKVNQKLQVEAGGSVSVHVTGPVVIA